MRLLLLLPLLLSFGEPKLCRLASPGTFTLLLEPGTRFKYMWWDGDFGPWLGEIRHTACIGGTLRAEHWLDTGYGWVKWGTYLITTNIVVEEDDRPRLARAGDTCLLSVANGQGWRKEIIVSELYLPVVVGR